MPQSRLRTVTLSGVADIMDVKVRDLSYDQVQLHSKCSVVFKVGATLTVAVVLCHFGVHP